MLRFVRTIVPVLLAISLTLSAAELPQRWVYIATNHLSDAAMDDLESVMKRAAAAGYTGIQLNDSKFAKLDDLGGNAQHYFKNVERIKRLAAELKLELIPGLYSIGYSNDHLWHNPNLAEG
jgi:sugar phosphate isomerase/epimerase